MQARHRRQLTDALEWQEAGHAAARYGDVGCGKFSDLGSQVFSVFGCDHFYQYATVNDLRLAFINRELRRIIAGLDEFLELRVQRQQLETDVRR